MNKKSSTMLRIIGASSVGTILEWYDFSLFAFLTPLIAKLFFQHEDNFTALMLTYTVFAIGFFARPIGAAIFGHFGDRLGRKQMLVASILMMTVPTFAIGLLPTYADIGILAPILLIVMRLLQGLSAGGEATGAVLFVVESHEHKFRGFVGAIMWAVVGIGMLLGAFAAMLVTHYSNHPWAWRVPFLFGIVTGLVGYFVRKRTPETHLFQKIVKQHKRVKFPLREGIMKYKKEMFIIMAIYTLSAMITYMIFVFMPTYASNIIGMPLAQTTVVSTLALACNIFLVPFGGYLSDIIGRKKCLGLAALGFLIFSYPLFLLISQGQIHDLIIAEIFFILFAAIFQGTINAAGIELVPTAVRFSMIAVGYNLSYSLFGGTAPLLASYLARITNNHAAPAFYLMAGALLACIAAWKMRETAYSPLA